MKSFINKIINNIKLLVVYGSPFNVRNFIVIAEFVIALVLSNLIYSFVTIDKNCAMQYKYMADNNIVMCDSLNEEQLQYCEQNGQSIGGVKDFVFFEKNDMLGTTFNAVIYDENVISDIKLPIYKGVWFENKTECDFVAVVAYEYKNEFDVGKTYNLFYEDKTYNVYISAILKPHINLLGDFICKDINNVIEKENSFVQYYKLKNIDISKQNELEIVNFDEMYKESFARATDDNVWNYILLISILVVFFAGYIGERLLNTDYQERLFATLFLCGVSKKKAFTIQFFQGFFVLVIASVVGRAILSFLYSVQFISQFFVPSIFAQITISALLIQTIISTAFVCRMSRKSIVQILKGSEK